MVSDFRNRNQIEQFLRNASAEDLLAQRNQILEMMVKTPSAAVEVERFAARIAYELRFRVPQAY